MNTDLPCRNGGFQQIDEGCKNGRSKCTKIHLICSNGQLELRNLRRWTEVGDVPIRGKWLRNARGVAQGQQLALALAGDLGRLASVGEVCEKSLAASPVFVRYVLVKVPVTVCMGVAHASGSDEEALTHTDEIVVDGSTNGWIRTRSGLYRLGSEIARLSRD